MVGWREARPRVRGLDASSTSVLRPRTWSMAQNRCSPPRAKSQGQLHCLSPAPEISSRTGSRSEMALLHGPATRLPGWERGCQLSISPRPPYKSSRGREGLFLVLRTRPLYYYTRMVGLVSHFPFLQRNAGCCGDLATLSRLSGFQPCAAPPVTFLPVCTSQNLKVGSDFIREVTARGVCFETST